MKISHRRIKPARVEMMPLIDIVFLLLVFFIYAMLSMAVHRGIELDLPESSSATQTMEKETYVHISIKNRDGEIEISLNQEQVPLGKLSDTLLGMNAEETHSVLLFAEETVSYQQLYLVLDELKNGGFTEISLQASTDME